MPGPCDHPAAFTPELLRRVNLLRRTDNYTSWIYLTREDPDLRIGDGVESGCPAFGEDPLRGSSTPFRVRGFRRLHDRTRLDRPCPQRPAGVAQSNQEWLGGRHPATQTKRGKHGRVAAPPGIVAT